jgi:FAD/FMN-containing dehydrogenase
VRTLPEALAAYRSDESAVEGSPRAVVAPRDADDLVALVRWARHGGVALVARGAGTSLDGESAASDGSVVVDFSGWSSVLEVEPEELWARVGPGVVNWDLQRTLRPQGVFFPPNPGSWTRATIGGHVGTNASGPRSFRYGPTRSWIRALDVVLGTGERARFGARVEKRSVGPDLLQLIVGSEGTLALVTEVTVRLAPVPMRREGLVVSLPGAVSLSAVARRLRPCVRSGLSAVEYIDRASASVLTAARRTGWPEGSALLLLELEADSEIDAERRRDAVVQVLRSVGIGGAPTVFPDSDELWTLRGESSVALDERMGRRVREDIAVPLGRIDALIHRLDAIAASAGVALYTFGHLGEGSFHPNFVIDPRSEAGVRLRAEVLGAALDLGGTVSSEHGIGFVKVPFLERELGRPSVELLGAVKRQCDPDGILNPGKLYPARQSEAAGRPSPSREEGEAGGAPSP